MLQRLEGKRRQIQTVLYNSSKPTALHVTPASSLFINDGINTARAVCDRKEEKVVSRCEE